MKREPSTLFAPGPLSGPGSFELLPMSPDIQAIYDAALSNTPFSTDVDQALDAHRNAHGEPAQIEHAKRVDPCDAMPMGHHERRRAYVSQRRYAVAAHFHAGIPAPHTGQVLNVPVKTVYNDRQALGLFHRPRKRPPSYLTVAGRTPAEVQCMLDEGLNHSQIARRLGVSRQAVNKFCQENGLTRRSPVSERREMMRQLSGAGLSIEQMAERLGVPKHVVAHDRATLRLPRLKKTKLPVESLTLVSLNRAEVQGLLMRFETAGALARHLKTDRSNVSQYLKRAGLKAPRDGRATSWAKRR